MKFWVVVDAGGHVLKLVDGVLYIPSARGPGSAFQSRVGARRAHERTKRYAAARGLDWATDRHQIVRVVLEPR